MRESLTILGLIVLFLIMPAVIVSKMLRSFRDPCPEEGCNGILDFDRDEIHDGIPVAIWTCSHCPVEQVISARSAPRAQHHIDGDDDVSPPRS